MIKTIRTYIRYLKTYSGRYGVPMEMYKMLMEINRKLVFGEEIPDAEKKDAVAAFLNGV